MEKDLAMLDAAKTRTCLKEFDFEGLFLEELGWDKYTNNLHISVNSEIFSLNAIAEKRGMAAFLCNPSGDGTIPDYTSRRKIEKQVAKSVHEHIIIYVNEAEAIQIWQWVRRETGRPTACREHTYHKNQPGDSLIQKLQSIAFSLEEEENLTLVDVAGRTRSAFDLDRVTKRFYDRFKKEHDTFLKFIEGIPNDELLRWYASVMLNRLMFVYFIQKKGFLNNDLDYLRHRLVDSQSACTDGFYKSLLCPLFFEGFAKKENERTPAVNQLFGKVPYLNGGIFLKHQIEDAHGDQIQIPDTAFEKLFDFFDQYQWHLDERPLRADNEINPDVLGYIFEKYINQKQMGAYYTKEDITEYISKNTIIPFLFDEAKQKCRIAFEGGQSIWKLLQSEPDRYIYDAVRKGVDLPLPDDIAIGLDDVSKRTGWNKPASEEFALPTEIWREVVARRTRYNEVKHKALGGEITSINDFITYNLNIRQFANDVIENCEGPELLRAFYHAIEKVTVLDPTCGSGAFLFAALNILEPLYESCLDRMEVFLDELERSGEKHRSDKFGDFKKILKRIDDHPNRRYFVLKSIIINNLFGVDIMEEAVEICKLRLFLKLIAQVEEVEKIEPLPDIDFNVRAGNTLVGFARLEDVKQALSAQLFAGDALKRIEEKAEEVDSFFELFRQMQTEQGMDSHDFSDAKKEVGKRLKVLEEELNGYLAESYGVDMKKKRDYEKWLASHKPFHWFVEFYGILKHGGFDVIIGNPPYVELSVTNKDYGIRNLSLLNTGNLFAVCLERFTEILAARSRMGVIVPISAISTPRMSPLMTFLQQNLESLYSSNFAVRPGKLFVGADMNLSILVGQKRSPPGTNNVAGIIRSTKYNRWLAPERKTLFEVLQFNLSSVDGLANCIPKIGSSGEIEILRKFKQQNIPPVMSGSRLSCEELLYYHSGGRYFRKCLRDKLSNEYKPLRLSGGWSNAFVCFLSSSLYYWFWLITSDCYHVTSNDISNVRVPQSFLNEESFNSLSTQLIESLLKHSTTRSRQRADGSQQNEVNFKVSLSKPIIDEIDRVLAKHYGFTDEELDFIINYDIKYRMGLSTNGEQED